MPKGKKKNITQVSETEISYLPSSELQSRNDLEVSFQKYNIMSIREITAILKREKKKLNKRFKIKRLALFGSYARNEQTLSSDLDIMVEFKKPIGIEFIELAEALEKALNLKVDLVSQNAVKPRFMKLIEKELIYV